MTPRAPTLTLLVVVVAAAAGCESDSHSSAHQAEANAAGSGLRGKIVFRRFLNDAQSHGALFVMNANGTGVRQITRPPAQAVDSLNGPPSPIADGSSLIFDRSTSDANGIFRVRLDGGREQEVPAPTGVPGDGWPVVSPDGTRIAVARAWGHPDEFQDLKTGLYVLGIDGAHPRLVADFGYRADVGGATWSPDGKALVFSVHNNGPGKPAEGTALFVVSARGRGLRRLTPWETDQQVSGPAFSPDGRKILFRLKPAGQDFGGDYWTVNSDGSSRQRLTHFGAEHTTGSAMWSPDGSMIVFADSGMGGNDDLYAMRADGGGVRRLTRTPQWESAAVWLRA
jgi:TolB protein